MAFEDRQSLEAEIAAWLDRDDLTARIPGFIRLLEADLNSDPKSRSPWQTKRCNGTTNSGFTQLPDNWLEAIRFRVPAATNRGRLTYKSPHELQDLYDDLPAGDIAYYTIIGRSLQFAPAPADATVIELLYYESVQLGDEPGDTNWLLEKFPHVYLWGALVMANAYLKHDERVQTWADRFTAAREMMHRQSEMAQTSGGLLNRGGAST